MKLVDDNGIEYKIDAFPVDGPTLFVVNFNAALSMGAHKRVDRMLAGFADKLTDEFGHHVAFMIAQKGVTVSKDESDDTAVRRMRALLKGADWYG